MNRRCLVKSNKDQDITQRRNDGKKNVQSSVRYSYSCWNYVCLSQRARKVPIFRPVRHFCLFPKRLQIRKHSCFTDKRIGFLWDHTLFNFLLDVVPFRLQASFRGDYTSKTMFYQRTCLNIPILTCQLFQQRVCES